MGMKGNVHYRLPLRLINSGDWAKINLAARVILPVIGVHTNENGVAFPGMVLISELSGYKDPRTVRNGINSLIENGLLSKKKRKTWRGGRYNVYYLLGNAICREGRSYFPIYKDVIEEKYWANLVPSEISVLGVMGVKATRNNPEAKDLRELGFPIFGMGTVQRKKMIKLSGISESSFDYAIEGLIDKGWINFNEEYEYEDKYEVYLRPLMEDNQAPNNALYPKQKVPNNALYYTK